MMASSSKKRGKNESGLDARRLAEAVQAACLETVIERFEQARMSGLCAEGAWEVAVGALRTLDLDAILQRHGDALKQEQ